MNPFWKGFAIHCALAVTWLLLQRGGVPSLITGMFLSFGLILVLQHSLHIHAYVRRSFGFIHFLYVFLRELILSNLRLAYAVLFVARQDMHPDFLEYDVRGLTKGEIFLLAQCITLTPGTTTVEVLPDEEKLILHAFDAADAEAVRQGIDQTLRAAILGFTR